MTTFELQNKPAITTPVSTAIMPVHTVSGGNYTLQHITQANLFARPLPIGSTTPNTGAFTTLNVSTSSTFPSGTATLTPLGSSTAGSATTSTNSFRYQVIGKRVYCNFYLIMTSKGGMTGNLEFEGLPFPPLNTGGARVAFNIGAQCNNYDISGVSGAIGLGFYIVNNTTKMLARVITTTAGNTGLNVSNIADNFSMFGQFFYEIA